MTSNAIVMFAPADANCIAANMAATVPKSPTAKFKNQAAKFKNQAATLKILLGK